MNIELFIKELEKLNIVLDEEKLRKLELYYDMLVEWNEKINLTRIIEKEDVYLKHFYDSLTLIKAIDLNKELYICDLGTGAGFPGIVLKIVFPNLKIKLIDSLNKRIIFLNEVINRLELDDIEAIHTRAEDYAKDNREVFDVVTSRAVANLKVLSELSIPMVKVGGYFIPMKASIEEELKEAESIIHSLSGKLEKVISFNLPVENSIRNIVIIKKTDKTNPIYPRRFDKIKK